MVAPSAVVFSHYLPYVFLNTSRDYTMLNLVVPRNSVIKCDQKDSAIRLVLHPQDSAELLQMRLNLILRFESF